MTLISREALLSALPVQLCLYSTIELYSSDASATRNQLPPKSSQRDSRVKHHHKEIISLSVAGPSPMGRSGMSSVR